MAKKKATPTQGRYSYVPAALNSSNFGGLGLYVRYGHTGVNNIQVVESNPHVMWVKTPDRDLVFVADSHHQHSWTPSGGTFDEYLNLSVFHEEAAKDFGLDYYMTNFTEFIGARNRKSLNLREGHKHVPGTPKVISDSGGFQLLTGKLHYVDPIEAVQWYNKNVDIGIVLDIPSMGVSTDMLKRMAKVQKRNTDLMLEHKTPELELLNIFHGSSMKERELFRKIVEDDRIDRLAIGGSYNKSILLSIYELLKIASTGRKYKQYHILGVTNFLQVVALLRLTQKGLIEHVTSDSSTHIGKAFKKEYLHQSTLTSNIVHLQIGKKHIHPSIGNRLPCSCPVCSRVKYSDVFSLNDGMALNGALAWHNMHFYNEYISRMKDVATLPIKELSHLIHKQLGTRHGVKEAVHALQFVDAAHELGLDKATKKYELFIENNVQYQEENNLFSGVSAPADNEYHERISAVIQAYETGAKGESNKRSKVSLRVKRSQAKRTSTKKKKKSKKVKKHEHGKPDTKHSPGPISIKR